MARSFSVALVVALCLAVHLMTVACARHAPTEVDGLHVVDRSPTYSGPSPSAGHGKPPSAAVAVDGALGVSAEFSASLGDDAPATGAEQHGAGGDGGASAARP
ncbi:hypothetical protein ABZP36_015971 [Zizania latifolia]